MSGLKRLKRYVRPFFYKNEIILSEQFAYGHREVYQRFLNFSPNKYVLAELQHGWYLDPSRSPQFGMNQRILSRKLKPFPFLVWSRGLAQAMNQGNKESVYAICSPWYLLTSGYELFKANNKAPNYFETPGSVLFFPSHSFPGINYTHDTSKLEEIMNFPSVKSITTSLYWTDFLNPTVREQFARFSTVTCVGIRSTASTEVPWQDIGGRVNFLYRLHRLISEHELVICEDFSTAAMAALTLGKRVFINKSKVNHEIVHRSEKRPLLVMDNEAILTRYGLLDNRNELGYEISNSLEVLELAKLGFGYDISLEETQEVLGKFLGDSSFILPGHKLDNNLSATLW